MFPWKEDLVGFFLFCFFWSIPEKTRDIFRIGLIIDSSHCCGTDSPAQQEPTAGPLLRLLAAAHTHRPWPPFFCHSLPESPLQLRNGLWIDTCDVPGLHFAVRAFRKAVDNRALDQDGEMKAGGHCARQSGACFTAAEEFPERFDDKMEAGGEVCERRQAATEEMGHRGSGHSRKQGRCRGGWGLVSSLMFTSLHPLHPRVGGVLIRATFEGRA